MVNAILMTNTGNWLESPVVQNVIEEIMCYVSRDVIANQNAQISKLLLTFFLKNIHNIEL